MFEWKEYLPVVEVRSDSPLYPTIRMTSFFDIGQLYPEAGPLNWIEVELFREVFRVAVRVYGETKQQLFDSFMQTS